MIAMQVGRIGLPIGRSPKNCGVANKWGEDARKSMIATRISNVGRGTGLMKKNYGVASMSTVLAKD